jgi:hypothetical protein
MDGLVQYNNRWLLEPIGIIPPAEAQLLRHDNALAA